MVDERVKANAEVESVALRCARVFQHKRLYHPLPPVLNLPFILWWAVQTGYAFLQEKRRQSQARTIAAFLTKKPNKDDKVLQFFHFKNSVCLLGRDAGTVASDYPHLHSKVGVSYVKHGSTYWPFLSINKTQASKLKRDVIKNSRRVTEYHRQKGEWKAGEEAARASEARPSRRA